MAIHIKMYNRIGKQESYIFPEKREILYFFEYHLTIETLLLKMQHRCRSWFIFALLILPLDVTYFIDYQTLKQFPKIRIFCVVKM